MISLEVFLQNTLASLQQTIVPELHSPKAKAAAASMERILARMIMYAPDSKDSAVDTPAVWFAKDPALREFHASGQTLGHNARVSPELADLYHREWQALASIEDQLTSLMADLQHAAPDPGAATPSQDIAPKLELYLRKKYAAPDARVTDFHIVVGGRSKQTAFFTVEGLKEMTGTFVLRSDLQVNLSGGKSIAYEYPLQTVLAEYGLKVPRPRLLEMDVQHIGQPFMVVEKLEGSMAGQYFYPPQSQRLIASYAAELARLHAVPLSSISGLEMEHKPLPREALAAEINELRRVCIASGNSLSLILETAYAWLLEHIDIAYRDTPCIAHRDALFHNVLADGDNLTAILDWELARVSYAAEDLGYIRSTVPLSMPWDDFMQYYEKAAGRKMDQAQVDYYAILSVARNCSMASNIKRLIAEKHTRDIELTSVTLHDFYRMQYQLGEHLNRVMGR